MKKIFTDCNAPVPKLKAKSSRFKDLLERRFNKSFTLPDE